MSQHMDALDRANRVAEERTRQREALRHKPQREVITVLLDPPPEFASYQLRALFTSKTCNLIRGMGEAKFRRVLHDLNGRPTIVRNWTPDLRLRDLTKQERRQFVRALQAHAPQGWEIA